MKKQIPLKDPEIRILIITAVIIFATFLFCQKFIIKPNREKITGLRNKLAHIKAEDEIARLENDIKACEKSLPLYKDPSWVLSQLTGLTKKTNLKMESVEPLPIRQIPPYSFVPFKFKTTCTFAQLVNFIEMAEKSQYILIIESINLDSKAVYKPELPKEQIPEQEIASVEIVIGSVY